MTTQEFAERLDRSAVSAAPVAQLTIEQPFSLGEAYKIQRALVHFRVQRGFPIIGVKMGFTSVAKMKQMGVHDLIWGLLTEDMLIENGGKIDRGNFIHPRAEPEVCFRTSKAIDRELRYEELRDYVDGIAPAIEIIDSRFMNFKFSLEDVVADNCSSAAFVVGKFISPSAPIGDLPISLIINDKEAATGNSKDILGDPWRSLQAATRLAAGEGHRIEAGQYVMAGAATSAEFIHKGDQVEAKVFGVGEVGFEVA